MENFKKELLNAIGSETPILWRRWIEWLYQAKKRYGGLSVLNYMVTSNHIHLLVFDDLGRSVIPDSIKLVAGRTAQEYNVRKNRKGAFWEDPLKNPDKENKWTQSIAVGSKSFVKTIKHSLGFRAKGRKVVYADDTFELREDITQYGQTNNQDSDNSFL